MNKKANIINVVSGKGGTGKTLFLAVLAQTLGARARVLVIDLDIFVRGLSSLYHQEEGCPKDLMEKDQVSVSSFFLKKYELPKLAEDIENHTYSLGIMQHGNYSIWPAVQQLTAPLSAYDLIPNNLTHAIDLLNALLKPVKDQYDYIFLDNRAGFDELIAAAHLVSTCSLCIDEDDSIANVTSDTLIEQLSKVTMPNMNLSYDTMLTTIQNAKDMIHTCMEIVHPSENTELHKAYEGFKHSAINFSGEVYKVKEADKERAKQDTPINASNPKEIFRIYNKCRNNSSGPSSPYGNKLPPIPFDADVMENFGKDTFEMNLNKSRYKEALCKAWNKLLEIMGWSKEHEIEWYNSSTSQSKIEDSLSILTKPRRLLFVSGYLITVLSLLLLLVGDGLDAFVEYIQYPSRLLGTATLLLGILLLVYAPINFRMFSEKKTDTKDKKTSADH